MTVGQLIEQSVAQLEVAGVTGARLDAQLLIAHAVGRNRAWVMAHPEFELGLDQLELVKDLMQRRAQREPVVHLTNKREFYGLEFYINADVLTPRAETEQMVEWAVKSAPKDSRLIDVGTGSGAIAVAIAKQRPDLKIMATDVTDEALAVARQNIAAHKVQVELVKSDLFESVKGEFDTVVTNLPYLQDDAELMPEVQKEPAVALHGGADGLDLYRRFLQQLPSHLRPGGYLFTECDPWQHAGLIEAAANQQLLLQQEGYFILGFQLAS
ncbi:peptide chain release factor N(5)-glutamine methyltransferase [Patescibacteria group bacterium]|nr:MAG: peptide chain release factor N(5)-glutamine methyltransferase [Patescibacteria group bacterium]